MFKQTVSAFSMVIIMTLLLGIIYPLGMTAIAGVIFPKQAAGSLIEKNGQVVGSSLIGQNFNKPEYFHPRPSAAGDNGYDATASGASNLGPTSEKLMQTVGDRIKAVRAENNLNDAAKVPADSVLASSSGLDPQISPMYAYLQVERVAKLRGLPQEAITKLVDQQVEGRTLGIFGEPTVNVLKLNIALDNINP